MENQNFQSMELMSPGVDSKDSKTKDMSGTMAKNATTINTIMAIGHFQARRLILEIWPDFPDTVVNPLRDLVNQLFKTRINMEKIIKIVDIT